MRDWLNIAWYHARTTGRDLVIALVICGAVVGTVVAVVFLLTLHER